MKLLICTQAVDRNDPYLGFFERWVEELSKHYTEVTVLCLRAGEYTLPAHVRVLPLGAGRIRRTLRLLRYSVMLHRKYDAVFVHMSQEFVLAGGWLWRVLGKPVYLWRNHYSGNLLTRVAALFCRKVFYTSRYSYTARLRRAVRMPVGVDMAERPAVLRRGGSVLFFGRLAPSKRPEMLIDALARMPHAPEATFCGPGADSYVAGLRERAAQKNLNLQFKPGIPHKDVPQLFAGFDAYVNAAPSGMLDKTIFEAAAFGCVPLASSKDWQEMMPELYFGDSQELAGRLAWYLALPSSEKDTLRTAAKAHALAHSLPSLAKRLAEEIK